MDGGQTGRPIPGMGMMPGSHAAMPGSQGGPAGPGGQDDWVPKSYLEKGRLEKFFFKYFWTAVRLASLCLVWV